MKRHGAGQGSVACRRSLPQQGLAQKDEHKRQVERLRAELEAERLRSQELQRRFDTESRQLQEAAERKWQLLAKQLQLKWERRQAEELQRLRELNQQQRVAEICQLLHSKEDELRQVQGTLQQQRDVALRQVQELQQQLAKELVRGGWSGSEACNKLQDALSKLRWEGDRQQAARILGLKQELMLQRRRFKKYILEHFEGEQPTSCKKATAKALDGLWKQTLVGCGKMRPFSVESLMAFSSDDGEGQPQSRGSFKDACLQEEGKSVEVLLEAVGQELAVHCLDSPQQGMASSGWSVAEVGVQTVGQQEDWLPGSSASKLLEQNRRLQSALKDLERRCSVLEEENCLLRKASSPKVQEEVERLKQKTARLGEQLQAADKLEAQVSAGEEGSYDASTPCQTCKKFQVQLAELTKEKSQVAEENAHLRGLMGLTFCQAKASGREVRSCLASECLQSQLEEAEGKLKATKQWEIESSSWRRCSEETKSVLQRKEEEAKCLQREHKESLQLFGAEVAELNTRYQKLTEQHQRLFDEREGLARERSSRIMCRPRQASMLGGDKESILLKAMRKQTRFELRRFIARYSYDPYEGPNEWPELELPLVAGEYVYIFGDVDEDGWYVGELSDGTRGFVPSNLVEEVLDDDLMTPESPETSDW